MSQASDFCALEWKLVQHLVRLRENTRLHFHQGDADESYLGSLKMSNELSLLKLSNYHASPGKTEECYTSIKDALFEPTPRTVTFNSQPKESDPPSPNR
ncbi:hypothetical protein H6P81_019304 [Aristolochia fimbriata]|uniref:Uncharacterized protein n=1 Tax=Aristolochia fimbriata TaxID=158543 RepID=A0AAV7DS79_ARIFI|nr:hypothetical protein H6P81_019304 [Aristolochia fimbriata]